VNRRRFLAAIGATALARHPATVGATPMMSDLIFDSCRGCLLETDPRTYRRNFRKLCRLMIRTGPFVLEGVVVSARRDGNEYVLVRSVKPFIEHQFPIDVSPFTLFSLKLPDEQLSLITGIPLASRTAVPAWAFRTS
jgi:hypothetical protein